MPANIIICLRSLHQEPTIVHQAIAMSLLSAVGLYQDATAGEMCMLFSNFTVIVSLTAG